jgi:hypothetical protein
VFVHNFFAKLEGLDDVVNEVRGIGQTQDISPTLLQAKGQSHTLPQKAFEHEERSHDSVNVNGCTKLKKVGCRKQIEGALVLSVLGFASFQPATRETNSASPTAVKHEQL